VDNVDGVIYLVEKEGVNLQEDTTFNKNYSIWHLKIKEQLNLRSF
jgi:hypothetical protein